MKPFMIFINLLLISLLMSLVVCTQYDIEIPAEHSNTTSSTTSNGTNTDTNSTTPDEIPDSAAEGLDFTDSDLDQGQLSGTLTITKATDESSISHYVLYWGTDAATKSGDAITEIAVTGSDVTYDFPADTTIPAGATHLLVFTKNSKGEMATGINFEIFDSVKPVETAAGISFFDIDMNDGKIGGTVYINKAADESTISNYVVYFGSDANTKIGDPIADLESEGTDLTVSIPLDTTLGTETHFLVYTKNNGILMEQNVNCIIKDHVETIIRASDQANLNEFGYSVSLSGDYFIAGAPGNSSNQSNGGSAYIFEKQIDGSWTEKTILFSSDMQIGDQFGYSAAISGDYCVVGAWLEDGGTGDPQSNSGAAYIFEKQGDGSWVEEEILRDSDGQVNDQFGKQVAIYGDYAAVGAPSEDGGAGDTVDNSGTVYIFKRQADGSWLETDILRASDAQTTDLFGSSLALHEENLLIGAYMEDGGDGDPANDAGAVYFFERQPDDSWIEKDILHASDMQAGDGFGIDISIQNDYAIVGAYQEDGGEGDPLSKSGAAYIFERQAGGNWEETAILHASNAEDSDTFGYSVAIHGNYAAISANGEDGVENLANNAGGVYIFERQQNGSWMEATLLYSSELQAWDMFGFDISMDDNSILTSARWEQGGDGDPNLNAGTVYMYSTLGN